MPVTSRRLTLGLDEQIAERYLRVPFTVEPGAESIEVRLAYDTKRGVVDLGCEGARGWRGWSGGARSRYVISAGAATPGYLPGEPEPGEWHVVLGLHQVPADGLEVVLEVHVPAVGGVEQEARAQVVDRPRGSARGLPAPEGLEWVAGDFHAHTVHSDGSLSVDELAATAVRSGLDFLAVTDHNTTSHHRHLPVAGARHSLSLVPGQEVTTARGHANALGDVGWIDFRAPAETWQDEVRARGGMLSVNHAITGDCSWLHPVPEGPHALELWHGSWLRQPAATSVWVLWGRWDTSAAVVGGSDFHTPGVTVPGAPTTWVAVEDRTPEAVVDAVRAGRTAISLGAAAPGGDGVLSAPVLLRLDGDVLAVDADGAVLVDVEGRRRRVVGDRVRIPESWGEGLLRLEDADRHLLALC